MTEQEVLEERRRQFGIWKQDKITKLLMSKLKKEVEEKIGGLAWDSYENPEIVKGYIRAWQTILDLDMEGLFSDD